ncbi:MAG: hypothetical protein ACR2P2_02845 [Nakamurella sp.]
MGDLVITRKQLRRLKQLAEDEVHDQWEGRSSKSQGVEGISNRRSIHLTPALLGHRLALRLTRINMGSLTRRGSAVPDLVGDSVDARRLVLEDGTEPATGKPWWLDPEQCGRLGR